MLDKLGVMKLQLKAQQRLEELKSKNFTDEKEKSKNDRLIETAEGKIEIYKRILGEYEWKNTESRLKSLVPILEAKFDACIRNIKHCEENDDLEGKARFQKQGKFEWNYKETVKKVLNGQPEENQMVILSKQEIDIIWFALNNMGFSGPFDYEEIQKAQESLEYLKVSAEYQRNIEADLVVPDRSEV